PVIECPGHLYPVLRKRFGRLRKSLVPKRGKELASCGRKGIRQTPFVILFWCGESHPITRIQAAVEARRNSTTRPPCSGGPIWQRAAMKASANSCGAETRSFMCTPICFLSIPIVAHLKNRGRVEAPVRRPYNSTESHRRKGLRIAAPAGTIFKKEMGQRVNCFYLSS